MNKLIINDMPQASVDQSTLRPGSGRHTGHLLPPTSLANAVDEDDVRPSSLLHASSPVSLPSPSRRVLILEDEPFCARAYSLALSQGGYEVDVVDNGEHALQMLLEQNYCAVVADLCLPGMSGLELLRCVRVHDLDTIVLLVTAAADFSSATEALRHGASQFLLKPLRSKQLVGEVNRAARLHDLAVRRRQAMRLLAADQEEESLRSSENQLISRAIGALRMAFQPIFGADGQVFGYEALMRSGEPAFKGPLDVLEAAERLGRLVDLGRACRSKALRDFSRAPQGTKLFLNLHPQDLLDDDLFAADSPLAAIADRVVLELTERAPLGENEELLRRVAHLRSMGFRVAIDDLGNGYAGLSSLVQIEPEFVKLDMSLVRNIHQNPIKLRLVALILETCRSLGIQVVAEGVETREEYDTLQNLHCPLFQGYYLARPAPLP